MRGIKNNPPMKKRKAVIKNGSICPISGFETISMLEKKRSVIARYRVDKIDTILSFVVCSLSQIIPEFYWSVFLPGELFFLKRK
ncbi:hypothetical protein [Kosmotoga olearia]|uniref:hypothetical protein n=1 Tax=Kosmotoga olearia TaxID=651457 RepID=UPI00031D822A|nr:hypothetical protein [Kosmotoga olearia]